MSDKTPEDELLEKIKEAGEVLDDHVGMPKKFYKAVDQIAEAVETYEKEKEQQ